MLMPFDININMKNTINLYESWGILCKILEQKDLISEPTHIYDHIYTTKNKVITSFSYVINDAKERHYKVSKILE